jgi:death-on-curing protein
MKEPIWINVAEALALHDRVLALHGGAAGVRDQGLLEAAINRPRQYLAYAETTDIVYLAAIATSAIMRNHPFVDGNKRTGFVTGILFMELNGYRFTADEAEAAQAALELAASTLTEESYAAFLAANSEAAG